MTFPVLDWHLNANVPSAYDHLGRIPLIFNPECADPAWQQITDNYPGGFNPEQDDRGWMFTEDEYLVRPPYPALEPSALAHLHDERILVYEGGWVVIAQRDGSYTVVEIEP